MKFKQRFMKKNQTIAQFLGIKTFPFKINNNQGKVIYYENSTGSWNKSEFDAKGNRTRYENSRGYWEKREFNANGNQIYHENSRGFWAKREYDSDGNETYFENSDGCIIDDRPKQTELTLAEIASKLNIPLELLRIKD